MTVRALLMARLGARAHLDQSRAVARGAKSGSEGNL